MVCLSNIFSSGRRTRTELIAAVAAWAVASSCANVPRADNWVGSICPRDADTAALGTKLSANAQILYPGTAEFLTATKRWSVFSPPTVSMVIVPAVEQDVAEAVKYANQQGKPFLAVNGGHGAISSVGAMKDGIQIWMDQLNTVTIAADGKSAQIGGGTLSKVVTDSLWAAGKQTVTGACECVSVMGPGLGGGHGYLQGRHGLVADQFISLNMVMADGEQKTVTEQDDLFWAMKGAGHNFGIVTSFQSKIYDVTLPDWSYQAFIYTGDKVEQLYDIVNNNLGSGTKTDVVSYSFFINMNDIDPNNSVVMFFLLQEGVKVVDPTLTAPFIALGPAWTKAETGPYTMLPVWTGNGANDAPCQKTGNANLRFPIDIDVYDLPAVRKAYDLFNKGTHENAEFAGSFMLFESYSIAGVKAIPYESTAYPFRDDDVLIAPVIVYPPGDAARDAKARQFGEDLREIIHQGSGRTEMHTYVNYAFGQETKQNMYGFEQWRQDKLTSLKQKYDPNGKFSFYAPI